MKYALGDVAVVVDARNPEDVTVVTFLGDGEWRCRWKNKEMRARRSPKVLAVL